MVLPQDAGFDSGAPVRPAGHLLPRASNLHAVAAKSTDRRGKAYFGYRREMASVILLIRKARVLVYWEEGT